MIKAAAFLHQREMGWYFDTTATRVHSEDRPFDVTVEILRVVSQISKQSVRLLRLNWLIKGGVWTELFLEQCSVLPPSRTIRHPRECPTPSYSIRRHYENASVALINIDAHISCHIGQYGREE